MVSHDEQARIAHAWEMMQQANKITLLTHYNPDGDGVSACAALEHILKKMGKSIETIYPTPLKADIKRQPSKILVNSHEQMPELIVICDTANYERLYYPEIFHAIPTINIDHHISSSIKPTLNFVDGQAPSTCDYLYRLISALDKQLIDRYVGECLLYGILYDTQTLSTQSTQAQVLHVVAEIVEMGISYAEIAQELMYRKAYDEVKFWGQVLANAQTNADGSVVWIVVTQKDLQNTGLPITVIAGLENFIGQLSQADVTILFYEDSLGRSRASFRAKKTDVNTIAKRFGGGGHKFAAGLMSQEPLDSLIPAIIRSFSE